jgi:hypothetical protein
VDLHLEIAYSDYEYFMHGPFGKCNYDDAFVDRARDEFFPNLSWMALLKNFVILKRGGLYTETIVDECVEGLVKWVFSYYDMNCVERVWIKIEDCGIPCDMIPSECQLKSLVCYVHGDELSSFDGDVDGRFAKLEHIGGMIALQHWTGLPNLRYIHGFGHSAQVSYVSYCDRKVWD